MRCGSKAVPVGLAFTLLLAAGVQAEVALTERHALRSQQVKAQKANKPNRRGAQPAAAGAIALDDLAGLRYHLNTDMTFSTTNSASGAASDAEFTGPVVATTSAGGTVVSNPPLEDAFDGYNGLCISQTGAIT